MSFGGGDLAAGRFQAYLMFGAQLAWSIVTILGLRGMIFFGLILLIYKKQNMRSTVVTTRDVIPTASYTVTQHSVSTVTKQRSNFNLTQFERIVGERQNNYKSIGQITDARYDDGGRYRGVLIDGVRVGRGDYTFPNGDYYNGFWEGDMFNGVGLYRYKNNQKAYFGEFFNNQPHGKGALTIDGSTPIIIYEGGWEQGLKHGIGIQFYSHDPLEYYEGSWVRGMRSGMGAYFYPDGTVYKGEWLNGKKHGKGELITRDGFIYHGIWNNDILQSNIPISIQYPKTVPSAGVIYDNYEGDHINGARNGRGVYRFNNGNQGLNQYSGDYRNNRRSGMGTYTTSFGDKYAGTFLDGKKHGSQGSYTWADGSTYMGTFENDNLGVGVFMDSKDGQQRQILNGRVQVA